MEIAAKKIKNYISTWLLGLFILGLAALLAFSELFQNVVSDDANFDNYSDPVKADILANIKTIRLSNRLGKFTLTLGEQNQWLLMEPRKMPAQAATIKKIFESLENISIHTLHQWEPINIQSFSLDNPVAILDLFTKLDEHIQVKIGLINPINNTAYLSFSNQDIIFQTDVLKHKLELLGLSDLIDSSIFSQQLGEIEKIAIFRGSTKEALNVLSRSPSGWESDRYRIIQNESVEKTLQGLLAIKTHMIVDTKNEALTTFMDNHLSNPLYRVEISSLDGKKTVYSISNLVNSMPDLKLEKRQYFLMKSSERQYPHLIHKDYLDRFLIKYQNLK